LRIRGTRIVFVLALAIGAVWLGAEITERIARCDLPSTASGNRPAAPVEVASFEQGPITLTRTYSGALEATAEFVVAPKVAGRIEQIAVDLSDPVERGQVVARLDDAEFVQAVAQADADVAFARANEAEARSALTIAERSLARIEDLRERDVASDSELDTAMADQLARQARLEVAIAQVVRAQASLEAAKIRLGYTRVIADWTGDDETRVVAERLVDEGETVAANAPLLSIVNLDPIIGALFVPERDYALLRPG